MNLFQRHAKSGNKSGTQKRRRGKCWKLPPDLFCQRCTNCSRQYRTADYIHDLTKNKRKIRRDSEAHTKQRTTLRPYRMIDQKCHEWRIKIWTATIDLMKAFESITHKSIWKALNSCGIEHDHISLLKKLYKDQQATVLTDEESDM